MIDKLSDEEKATLQKKDHRIVQFIEQIRLERKGQAQESEALTGFIGPATPQPVAPEPQPEEPPQRFTPDEQPTHFTYVQDQGVVEQPDFRLPPEQQWQPPAQEQPPLSQEWKAPWEE